MTIPLKYILPVLIVCICHLTLSGQQNKSDSLKDNNADSSIINHLNDLGWEVMFSNPDTSFILYNQALYLAEKIQWNKGIAGSLRNLGVYYYLISDGPRALDYYTRALKIEEELGNKNGIARTLNNIGLVYNDQGEYPKALDYYLRTLKIDEELGDKSGMAATMGNIGNIYEKQSDYPRALEYYFKSLDI
jgi:tetratricopeptide (TPR) repeat protein